MGVDGGPWADAMMVTMYGGDGVRGGASGGLKREGSE